MIAVFGSISDSASTVWRARIVGSSTAITITSGSDFLASVTASIP